MFATGAHPAGKTKIVSKTAASTESIVEIAPQTSRAGVNWDELWTHRDLLYFLVWRDLKVRYKQTFLGIAWVVLQPLLMTMVFTVVLGNIVKVPSGGIPYAVFVYSGLTLWVFFSGAISVTGNCLVMNAHLITKIYFPRIVIPLATIIARLVDLAVAFVILLLLVAYYRIPFRLELVLTLPLILLLTGFALGFGLCMSAINVRYRDVGVALPVLIQLWLFASPIVYPVTQVPEKFRLWYSMNPMVGIVENFRAVMFGTRPNSFSLLVSVVFTMILLIYGAYLFRTREKNIADLI